MVKNQSRDRQSKDET